MTRAADGMELKVEIDSAPLKRRLVLIGSSDTMRRMNACIGQVVLERVKDHLAKMSVSRHKTADRLGARHTGFYEHAAGRTVLKDVDEKGATVEVQNTPGMTRAFRDLHIAPTGGRKWLTMPISRVAYGKRVADLRGEGHRVFRPGKARILAEATTATETYTGKDGKKRKRKRLRPLYALVKSVRVPRDEGLLPNKSALKSWTREAVCDFMESLSALG